MAATVEKFDSDVINELSRRIVQAVHPLRIMLFGSAVRDQMGPDSDIDVLVVVPDGTHCLNTSQHLYKQLFGFGWPVDILVTTSEILERQKHNVGLVYRRILIEGKEIYAA